MEDSQRMMVYGVLARGQCRAASAAYGGRLGAGCAPAVPGKTATLFSVEKRCVACHGSKFVCTFNGPVTKSWVRRWPARSTNSTAVDGGFPANDRSVALATVRLSQSAADRLRLRVGDTPALLMKPPP
jgi:hypothetical protein